MKKITFILITLITFSVSAQKKKKNGTIYIEHPGIETVESFHKAFVDGDIDKAASYLADDMRIFNDLTMNKDSKGWGKKSLIANMNSWKNNWEYLSYERSEGSYPDAFEYNKSGNWVFSWNQLYAINKTTGVKFDSPVLRGYVLNDDNTKIIRIHEYNNNVNFRIVNDSFYERKNGVIYMNHEHINSVRKAMYSFANGDAEKAYSFFHDNAVFIDINENKNMNKDEIIARDSKIFSDWTLTGLDESGYPDYLEYDWQDSKVVQSWWNFRMTRNSDGKKVVVKCLFLDTFNDDGKIIRRNAYWNGQLLK
jgi:ketosteroid isomerase-like protein